MKTKHLALGVGGAIGVLVAWKFLTRAGEIVWEDVADKVEHSENSHFVEVDGATVHFQEFGDPTNPTLILLHGYTASVYVWKTSAPLLASEGFHVVAVDLIGFGFSDKPAWFDYSINSQARMVVRLMNRLGIGRATLVGSSYGGAVSATVALDYPERVEKLVLVDAVINDNLKNHPLLKIAAIPGVGELLTPFIADSKMYHRRRMYGTIAPANHHLITDERVDSVQRPLRAADAHHSLLATSRNWHAKRIEKDAHLISHPTLIIWGEEDTVIPLRDGETLYNSILNSRFVVLKNCGHVPQEEKPELFVNLVTGFHHANKGRLEVAESEEISLRGNEQEDSQ
jgi:pimeloyl-ACP methyl ester carboxylesterase